MKPETIQSMVLHRDGLVLVLNKPAGIPVHVGPGGGENLEQYFTHLQYGWGKPPALAHRLDRDTSGCLVLGRHPKALRKLGRLFSDGKVDKTYWAVVQGHLSQTKGTINLPLAKHSTAKHGWRMEVDEAEGKASVTDYEVLGTSDTHSWVACYPRTGRTHQIRVHLAALGHPIVGETIYAGRALDDTSQPTLHLHSRRIVLPLSASKPATDVSAPPPDHMLELLKTCGLSD